MSSLPEATADDAAHTVSLVTLDRPGSRRHRVVVDGGVTADDASRDQAVAQLLQALDDLAATGAGEALTFHAGAVARDGRAVLIAGSSGKGKSTLTAALVQRGWSYLTDEVAVVRLEDHRILPYPKALDLDEGSRKLLRIRQATVDLGARKQKVLPTVLGRVSRGATPVLVVLLDGTESRPVRGRAPLERLTPSEALVALIAATYERSIDGPERFQALAALCVQVPVVRMDRARLARLRSDRGGRGGPRYARETIQRHQFLNRSVVRQPGAGRLPLGDRQARYRHQRAAVRRHRRGHRLRVESRYRYQRYKWSDIFFVRCTRRDGSARVAGGAAAPSPDLLRGNVDMSPNAGAKRLSW